MLQMSARQLSEYLKSAATPPMLLDVREPWEFRIAHIEGSELVPLRQLPYHAGKLDPEREIVVICHHGVRSQQAARFLEQNGFENVINLAGGINAWSQDVDAEVALY